MTTAAAKPTIQELARDPEAQRQLAAMSRREAAPGAHKNLQLLRQPRLIVGGNLVPGAKASLGERMKLLEARAISLRNKSVRIDALVAELRRDLEALT